jgi:hypothetical protein
VPPLDRKPDDALRAGNDSGSGRTVREVARLLRVSPDRVRAWIKAGDSPAINTAPAKCGRPRYVVLPHHLDEFERRRRVEPPSKPAPRRRRAAGEIDFFPD